MIPNFIQQMFNRKNGIGIVRVFVIVYLFLGMRNAVKI